MIAALPVPPRPSDRTKGTARGRGVAPPPLPPFPKIRQLASAVEPGVYLQREPAIIERVRCDYAGLTDEARSLTCTTWPTSIDHALRRLQMRAFGGDHPESGLPNVASYSAVAAAALAIGLDLLLADAGIQLAVTAGQHVHRSDGGSDAARRIAMTLWTSLDPGEGIAPGSGPRRNLWIAGAIATRASGFAQAIGSRPNSVAIAAVCAALAAEPIATDSERRAFSESAAAFVTSVRLKAAASAAVAGAIL